MKKYLYLLLPIITLTIFIIWTIIVKTVDLVYIPDVGYLGLSHFNATVNNFVINFKPGLCHKLSNVLLYLSFASVLPFAIMGLVQLIKGKSLKAVNPSLWIMLLAYVLTVFFYFFFEIVKINYTPDSQAGALKASYPSSHVFLTLSLLGIGAFGYLKFTKLSNKINILVLAGVGLYMALAVVTRLLSGHHWFSDIIGGLLLAAFVVAAIFTLPNLIKKEENKAE